MDFKQLQSFAALAETGSFTRAAEKLFVSQPTISAHIRELESELRTPLVLRSTHAVELTRSGQELFEGASRILELRDSLLRRFSEEEQNTLRVGASTIPAAYVLPSLLPGFQRENPQIQLLLNQGDSSDVLDGLAHGRFDVGFTGMQGEDNIISYLPLCSDRMVLVTPCAQPYLDWKKEGRVDPEELKSLPFICREPGSGTQKNADSFLLQAGITEENRLLAGIVTEPESLKKLVAAGIGVALVSERSVREETAAGTLLTFDLPNCDTVRSLYLAVRRGSVMKNAAELFLRYVRSHVGDIG